MEKTYIVANKKDEEKVVNVIQENCIDIIETTSDVREVNSITRNIPE